jgi:hypothetical protein
MFSASYTVINSYELQYTTGFLYYHLFEGICFGRRRRIAVLYMLTLPMVDYTTSTCNLNVISTRIQR